MNTFIFPNNLLVAYNMYVITLRQIIKHYGSKENLISNLSFGQAALVLS